MIEMLIDLILAAIAVCGLVIILSLFDLFLRIVATIMRGDPDA